MAAEHTETVAARFASVALAAALVASVVHIVPAAFDEAPPSEPAEHVPVPCLSLLGLLARAVTLLESTVQASAGLLALAWAEQTELVGTVVDLETAFVLELERKARSPLVSVDVPSGSSCRYGSCKILFLLS